MKYIVWTRNVGDHSGDEVMMRFDTAEVRRQFIKAMQGVLVATDVYHTEDKHPKKCHIK
jgi:hypothetical protein